VDTPSGGTLADEIPLPIFVAPAVGLPNFAVVQQGVLMPGSQLMPTAPVVVAPAPAPVIEAPAPVIPAPEVPVPVVYLPKQDRN
jgi:hypothetical protein